MGSSIMDDQDNSQNLETHELTANTKHPAKPRPKSAGKWNFYASTSSTLGFNDKRSLAFLVIFGGALVGFCLARIEMLSPGKAHKNVVAGEWFWYGQKLYKAALMLHIYLCLIAGIGLIPQFIPAIRRTALYAHQINGYAVLILIFCGMVSGAIVGRRAFGGDVFTQAAFYTLAVLVLVSSGMGYLTTKRIKDHRKWMLRASSLLGVIITARLISIAARQIISDMGSYSSMWRCDEILSVMLNTTAMVQSFPLCGQTNGNLGSVQVAVPASMGTDKLYKASAVRATFGMGLWLGMVIHIIGVETYIRITESSNQYVHQHVLEEYEYHDDRKEMEA